MSPAATLKWRVFLDANRLFSASKRESGICRLVTELAEHHTLLTNELAVFEAQRNLLSKRPSWMPGFTEILNRVSVVTTQDRLLDGIAINDKDRPILVSAIHEKCDFLVTGDRRDFGHLFDRVTEGVRVVTPLRMAEVFVEFRTP